MSENFENVKLYFAPLEGITHPQYRHVHSQIFGGADCYYSPFIPTGKYDSKFLSKHFPDKEHSIPLVPQVIANDAAKFVETVNALKDFGYSEVNLNAGCPSSTVFSKYKGSGMLRDLDTFDAFLSSAFENATADLSIKTRMGIQSTDEFRQILPIYNKYKISLLTIHARDREGMYKSEVDISAFTSAFNESKNTVCYNGDIFCADQLRTVLVNLPSLKHVMIGRGAIANPSLFRMIRGGNALSINELSTFHEQLIDEYLETGLSPKFTAERVKALWPYMICMFPNSAREFKNIKKAHGLDEFKSAVNSLLHSCEFDGYATFSPFDIL